MCALRANVMLPVVAMCSLTAEFVGFQPMGEAPHSAQRHIPTHSAQRHIPTHSAQRHIISLVPVSQSTLCKSKS